MQRATILLLFYLLDFTSQQNIIGSFKSPNDDSIIIERNNWSEIHLGIVYQYENSDPGLERPFTIQLHYRGTCIQSNYPFLELHSSNYCPPEVLNQASDQNQACHQLILLVQGTNDTDNAIIGLNKDCVFQGSVNNKTLPLENQLTLQIKVIDKNPTSTVSSTDTHSATMTTSTTMSSSIKTQSSELTMTSTSTLQPTPTTASEASVSTDSTSTSKSPPMTKPSNTLDTTSDEQRWVITERTGSVWNLVNNFIQSVLLLLVYPIIIWRVMKHLKTRPQTTNGNTSNESIIKNSAFTNSEERRRENIEIEIAGPQEY